MRHKLIAGNWKMHGNKHSVAELLSALQQNYHDIPAKTEITVLPPYVFLDQVEHALANTRISWGAQNVAVEKNGAFTGEISAEMLLDFHCKYVIVGHSERRSYYGESDQLVAKKAQVAAQAGLTPIICLGESLAEREQNRTESVIERQLNAILALDSAQDLMQNSVFAYEPVWAIGTGKVATPVQAQAVHEFIRGRMAEFAPQLAQDVKIIYGGSVKANNAASLFEMPDIDGALVGGASLNAHEFLDICRCNN